MGEFLLVPAYPGSPGSTAVKRMCVCVCGHDLCTGVLVQHQKGLARCTPDDGSSALCFYRAMLCIRGTSHGPVSVVSVSVRLSQAGVLPKRQKVGSHKQHYTIPQDSSFLMPKISAKFDRGHPLRGRQKQVGWVKIGDF